MKTHATVVIGAKASNFYPPGADPNIAEHCGDPWLGVAKAERICGANHDAMLHQMARSWGSILPQTREWGPLQQSRVRGGGASGPRALRNRSRIVQKMIRRLFSKQAPWPLLLLDFALRFWNDFGTIFQTILTANLKNAGNEFATNLVTIFFCPENPLFQNRSKIVSQFVTSSCDLPRHIFVRKSFKKSI